MRFVHRDDRPMPREEWAARLLLPLVTLERIIRPLGTDEKPRIIPHQAVGALTSEYDNPAVELIPLRPDGHRVVPALCGPGTAIARIHLGPVPSRRLKNSSALDVVTRRSGSARRGSPSEGEHVKVLPAACH